MLIQIWTMISVCYVACNTPTINIFLSINKLVEIKLSKGLEEED